MRAFESEFDSLVKETMTESILNQHDIPENKENKTVLWVVGSEFNHDDSAELSKKIQGKFFLANSEPEFIDQIRDEVGCQPVELFVRYIQPGSQELSRIVRIQTKPS